MARMKFMNTEIDNLTMQETLRAIDQLIQEKKSAYVVTPNVDHIVQLETNNYNDAINTFTDEEFMKYSGYSVEMIYSALEQNLYSGMYFYIFAMIIVSFFIIAMIMFMTSKIGEYNLRESFYYDYIQIIKSIIENKEMDKYRKNR